MKKIVVIHNQLDRKDERTLLYLYDYRIRGNFCGLPIFAVFRGQYESAKIKIAKYFRISVKESSLEATSIFAAVTSSFPLLR